MNVDSFESSLPVKQTYTYVILKRIFYYLIKLGELIKLFLWDANVNWVLEDSFMIRLIYLPSTSKGCCGCF